MPSERRRRERGRSAPGCRTCAGEQEREVLLGAAAVLRCVDCGVLAYVQARTVRGRIRAAVVAAIEWSAPPSCSTGVGT